MDRCDAERAALALYGIVADLDKMPTERAGEAVDLIMSGAPGVHEVPEENVHEGALI